MYEEREVDAGGYGPPTDLAMSLLAIFICAVALLARGRDDVVENVAALTKALTERQRELDDTTRDLREASAANRTLRHEVEGLAAELQSTGRRREEAAEQLRMAERALNDMEQALKDERARGFEVPVPLAVRIDWDTRGVDIDLAVRGPNGETARFPVEERNQDFGNLMRDERFARVDTWEVFYAMQPMPGEYQVACSYYRGSAARTTVCGVVILHPADPERRSEKHFRIVLTPADKYPARRAAAFSIGKSNDEYQIRFGDFVEESG